MNSIVRVELVRRQVPADPATVEGRAALVDRMRNLGQLDTEADGQVCDTETAWFARIGGGEFPLVTHGMENVDGRILVSLVVEADSLHVGDPAEAPKAPPVEDKPPVQVWGSAGKPDPREGIPGWKPEAGQIHLSPSVESTPGLGQQIADNPREYTRRNGGAAGLRA